MMQHKQMKTHPPVTETTVWQVSVYTTEFYRGAYSVLIFGFDSFEAKNDALSRRQFIMSAGQEIKGEETQKKYKGRTLNPEMTQPVLKVNKSLVENIVSFLVVFARAVDRDYAS